MKEIKLNKKFYKEGYDYPDIQQFRIYDPSEKVFHYSGGTPTMLAGFFKFTASLHTYYGMPYQRMTFLSDKLKQKIYEGDIIKYEFICLGGTDIIIFRDGKFELKNSFIESEGYRSVKNISENCEIIGNIYQNKDLIK